MKISVFAIGKKMPSWVEVACKDYVKRLPDRWKFTVREFGQSHGDNAQLIMTREASVLLDAIPERSHVVALDNRGMSWSTKQLAEQLGGWQELGRDITFVVGGADGLHDSVLERANQQWCLSELTFPHPLVRVILTEQLYRAQSLLSNHPYHRA